MTPALPTGTTLLLVPLLTVGATPEATLLASDGQAGDEFGSALALQGDRLLVGAPGDDTAGGNRAGSVYVFERAGGAWSELQRLEASDAHPGNRFGLDVALDGDRLAVSSTDAVYVFERSGGTWSEQARISGSRTMDLDGETLVIGFRTEDAGGVHGAGTVHVHERSGGAWSLQATLSASQPVVDEYLGVDVAIDGDTVLAGTEGPSAVGATSSAFVFVRNGSGWSEQASLPDPHGETGDGYGLVVALAGDLAFVAAPEDLHLTGVLPGTGKGSVSIFERTGSTWQRRTKLVRSYNALFGSTLAVDPAWLAVGTGDFLHVYSLDGASPCPGPRLAPDLAPGSFSRIAAVSGQRLALGVPVHDSDRGAVVVYGLSGGGACGVLVRCNADDGSLSACPCGNAGVPESGCDNAQGTGGVHAILGAYDGVARTASVEGFGFPFASSPTAIVIRGNGSEPSAAPFFDGVRCVGLTGLVRLSATAAVSGRTVHPLSHGAAPGTYVYQIWYRNAPASFCDAGAAANASNSLEIVW